MLAVVVIYEEPCILSNGVMFIEYGLAIFDISNLIISCFFFLVHLMPSLKLTGKELIARVWTMDTTASSQTGKLHFGLSIIFCLSCGYC